MFNIFHVAWILSDSVPSLSLFRQLNHRSRFFLLPQESGCWLAAGFSLILYLLCGHAAVPAATSE